jgi:molybdopterin-containing oxidoreductase family iron-sulfur binding subunit
MSSLTYPTPEESLNLFNRRDFLKYMGASTALLSLEGCRNKLPPENLVPYAHAPEDRILGRPQSFATSFPLADFTQGLLVTSHEGLPTKIEGNPHHPSSLGATSSFAQAAILELYDPQRLTQTQKNKEPSSLEEFKSYFSALMTQHESEEGAGLCFLTERLTSPSLWNALERFQKKYPKAEWITWDPINRDHFYKASELTFGEPLEIEYDFRRAEVILSLDHDFLATELEAVVKARHYIESRAKLFVVEPSLTITGGKADQRWALAPSEMEQLISALEVQFHLSQGPLTRASFAGHTPSALTQLAQKLSVQLKKISGRSLILLGTHYPAALQARVQRLNAQLSFSNHFGSDHEGSYQDLNPLLSFRKPIHTSHLDVQKQLSILIQKMKMGQIHTLIIDGGNPALNAPSDFEFQKMFAKVSQKIHLSHYANETSADCDWVIPKSHFLESWSDAITPNGVSSILQPLLHPLYESLTLSDLLHQFTAPSQTVVKDFWMPSLKQESAWHQALKEGVIPNARPPLLHPSLRAHSQSTESVLPRPASQGFELILRPAPTIWDGRFAENAWLQELPMPFTYLTWDNAVLISAHAAHELGVQDEDVVELKTATGNIKAPVLIMAGLPEKTLTLHLGYGRTHTTSLSDGAGVNAYPLRSSQNLFSIPLLSIQKVAGQVRLARTQSQKAEVRPDLFRENFKDNKVEVNEDLDIGRAFPTEAVGADLKSKDYQWAMSLNLESCIGCQACVVACQAENNIPVVGKQQVLKGRVMHWIRIDRYQPPPVQPTEFQSQETPRPQPITCMHCEKAPCEVVCPVGATNHSSEGLNQMVYNRCVGTRYCSNNCPYKVRRFNFYKYTDDKSETLKMQRNPDVTVRSRGVMEKCTYCIQRITAARIQSEKEDRLIKDGEIRTACEAVCPTQAIVFGNLKDPESRVSRLQKDPRTYGLLTELGTRPRTTYISSQRREKA